MRIAFTIEFENEINTEWLTPGFIDNCIKSGIVERLTKKRLSFTPEEIKVLKTMDVKRFAVINVKEK